MRVMGRPKERFCKRGHDTTIAGRDLRGQCSECRRESDRRRRNPADPITKERIRQARRVRGYNHPIRWERARVACWLEIVAEHPMDRAPSTQARGKEFETRYQRLEAEVPTP